jgi:nicotinamidase-related amidase
MTTLSDRPSTALLVIDVQNGVMEEAFNRDAVIANIASLVGKARAEQVPVLWVQHSDDTNLPLSSPQWEYVAELPQGDGEPVVHKKFGDAFEATDLEERLAERGIGRLVVAGASSDACIRSTIHGAFTRGYDVTLVSDAHTTGDLSKWGAPTPELVVAHTNLYWSYTSAPGRTAGTSETAGVSFTAA